MPLVYQKRLEIGTKNTEEAIRWNQELKDRQLLSNEHKIDNSHNDPNKTAEEILKLLATEN